MDESNPKRKPLDDGITEETIHSLIHGFYAKVRADSALGPIFERAVAGDWEPHLAKMCDFWSSVMRMTGRYKGNPMVAHMRQKTIRPEHFERWLALFRETAREQLAPAIAELFVGRAETIAHSLQFGMFYKPAKPAAHEARP